MKKMIVLMLTLLVSVGVFTGCSKQTSAEPEADQLATITLKAILNQDYKTIYQYSQENYRQSMKDDVHGDPAFSGNSDEDIEEKEILNPGTYEKMKKHGDYLYGSYHGFLNEKGVILYYLDGYFNGSRQVRLFELQKEKNEWKIVRYNTWRNSTVHEKQDYYMMLIGEGKDKDVQVFHRGDYYSRK
ncbi:hypothetical protein COL23_25675 [Priestia aryabhattai]|uniref:hypothetical protein n=1 Tax=Priestia aryabhattai TaxID=412384 RepID=UPI000BF7D841|nr:hypothetical protein [Priestia aryabhattai]PFW72143.1 hypothetical protein COL23_25675 [Priestia aryabhattai]